jgi:hypothetical protein
MDAVLGWNLVLSLPVILVIAWLAGRLLGVPPRHRGPSGPKACRTTPSWWRGSAIRSRRRSMSWLMTTMASWASGVCSYWRVRRRQRCIQAKVGSTTQRRGWVIKPPLGLIPPTIWIVNRRILLTACTTLPV